MSCLINIASFGITSEQIVLRMTVKITTKFSSIFGETTKLQLLLCSDPLKVHWLIRCCCTYDFYFWKCLIKSFLCFIGTLSHIYTHDCSILLHSWRQEMNCCSLICKVVLTCDWETYCSLYFVIVSVVLIQMLMIVMFQKGLKKVIILIISF